MTLHKLSFLLALAASLFSSAASEILTKTVSVQTLNATAFVTGNGVSGTFKFTSPPNSEEVLVDITVSGLDAFAPFNEFSYHIHTNPIPPNGNCSGALGHLDPLNVTDSITCDPLVPSFCEEGDLAARHGKLSGNSSVYTTNYSDSFLRFSPQEFSILGRSIVIHLPNTTRLACGNITSILDGTADSNGNATGLPSNYVTQYPTRASPANSVKYAPFVGTSTISAVLANITVPAALPDQKSAPNVVLTASVAVQTIGDVVQTLTIPVAYPVATASGSVFTKTAETPARTGESSSAGSVIFNAVSPIAFSMTILSLFTLGFSIVA